MRNMFLIIANILKVTFRKKGSILIYLFMPLAGVVLSLLIYSNTGLTVVRTGFVDHDGGMLSADLKEAFRSSDIYKLTEISDSEINDRLLDMELDAAVIVPAGYTEGIYSGRPEKIKVISIKGQDTTAWINQLLNSYTDTLMRFSAASGGDRALFDRMYGEYKANPVKLSAVQLEDQKTGRYMALSSMGFLIMFLMLGAGFINMFILKEKRDRTYHRICSAPVRARQYIAGNVVASLLVVVFQILIIQIVMKFVLHIETGVSDGAMFLILFLFGLVAIGIGLVVTAFSSSTYMAGTLNTLILTPTCMLGGCFWDTGIMPDFMQKIGYFVPQRWAIDAIRKLQAAGAAADISLNLLILVAFAAALFLVAIYRFSRTINMQKFV